MGGRAPRPCSIACIYFAEIDAADFSKPGNAPCQLARMNHSVLIAAGLTHSVADNPSVSPHRSQDTPDPLFEDEKPWAGTHSGFRSLPDESVQPLTLFSSDLGGSRKLLRPPCDHFLHVS